MIKRLLRRLIEWAAPITPQAVKKTAIKWGRIVSILKAQRVIQQIEPYKPAPGVVPEAMRQSAMAMDSTPYGYVNDVYGGAAAFKGYQYLAQLTQLPEYRKFAETLAKEMTRKWITITSKGDDDKTDKISKIIDAMDRLKVKEHFRTMAEYDSLYGRGQLFPEFKLKSGPLSSEDEEELKTPLVMASAKIGKGSLQGFRAIEPVWTYPSAFNAQNPLAADYYKPTAWYVMNKTVHRTRLLTFVSRPVPDLLKASYNFGGLSMSQMAEPYVNNWLRTRDSISDMIHSYSTSGIKTNLQNFMADPNDSSELVSRAEAFTLFRDIKGLFMIDKDSEEFFQYNTPLSGLGELQEQAQGQQCMVSNLPPLVLFGVAPSGLNASGQGEMEVFYNYVKGQQETLYRDPLNTTIEIIQLSEFGVIDPDITFDFVPLKEMTAKEISDINKTNSDSDVAMVNAGILSPEESRSRIAADINSGHNGIDVEDMPEIEEPEAEKPKDKLAKDEGYFIIAQDAEEGTWRTINGAHILTNKEGEVVGGAEGKFNGTKLNNYQKQYITREEIEQHREAQKQKEETGLVTIREGGSEAGKVVKDPTGKRGLGKFKIPPPTGEKPAEPKAKKSEKRTPLTSHEKQGFIVEAGPESERTTRHFRDLSSVREWVKETGRKGDKVKLWDASKEMFEEEPHKTLVVGDELTQDEAPFTYKQFLAGFKAEQEHLDSVDGDEETIIKIVIDHLKEDPEYYSKMGMDAEMALDSITIAEDHFDYVGYANDAAHWITTEEGSHILIDGNGEVIGGAGGKLNGAKFERVQSKSKNIEQGPAENPKTPQSEHAEKKPKFPEFYQSIRDKHDKPYWNGKFYGDDKKGYRIYVSEKEYKIKPEQKKELEENRKDFLKWKESAPPEDKSGHQYLNVPYDDRNKAKAAGAKWDADKKKWYVPGGSEVPAALAEYTKQAAIRNTSAASGREDSLSDLRRKAREYDNLHNEGGEGYNPYRDKIRDLDHGAYFKSQHRDPESGEIG